ncbi:alpha/beta hydrolase [Paenarthrobacter ilicis]|uniref:Acetyl esterase/lipase n=1 Tax=Paenarthrobacter ilicis TaxID=43665 RepID=A0ABX0TJX0_9MICC|nr:alpha/beta hydrolase fold domain-containing protein [Paenarthrobacter ilicis]MBM7793059.1 acetyl esterase/lipase [Paenarthrobacter ilicis]NIJ02165.1 acetyl esterase/lipase [Paenarthrobacter ilicis]
MPLDPYFANKMKVLEKFASVADAMSNPETAKELAMAFKDTETTEPPAGEVQVTVVDTREGPVGVRLYMPKNLDPRTPVFVWVHGGGFAGGSIDMPESDTVARELAFLHGIPVVTVDYALSNGTTITYPVPHRQVADVVRWVRDHRRLWGSPDRAYCLGGASAGANLAVGSVLELREQNEELPAALLLVYPMVHRQLVISETLETGLSEALGLTRMNQGLVDHMFSLYTAGQQAPYASVDGHDLAGFPRTLTLVSEYDDLRPSGEAFHADLLAASVDAELYLAEGMPHGHLDRTRLVPEVGQTVKRMASFLTSN